MNLEDYTPEQRATWTPRQRQWYAVWRNNSNAEVAQVLQESLMTIDAEVSDEESTGQ
jgi:hypothetical protein